MKSLGFRAAHPFTSPCRHHQAGGSSGKGVVPGECQGCIFLLQQKAIPSGACAFWKIRPKAGALVAEEKGDAKAASKGSEPATR